MKERTAYEIAKLIVFGYLESAKREWEAGNFDEAARICIDATEVMAGSRLLYQEFVRYFNPPGNNVTWRVVDN